MSRVDLPNIYECFQKAVGHFFNQPLGWYWFTDFQYIRYKQNQWLAVSYTYLKQFRNVLQVVFRAATIETLTINSLK